MYYIGSFANNKPKGVGKWVFKNGNVLEGEYEQTKKVAEEGEEEEVDGDDDGVVKKPKFNLEWVTHSKISEAAHMVNSVD